MNHLKSHFKFNKQERSGIFFLLFFLVAIQVGYYLYEKNKALVNPVLVEDAITQKIIDSLKQDAVDRSTFKNYPYNPNYISDFKGYSIGMSVEEIDRLHQYRTSNKYINSIVEFQQVTGVSDSLLNVISPFFKFPDWTQASPKSKQKKYVNGVKPLVFNKVKKKDLNTASAEELQTISGIGEKLSARIVKYRNRLGGFLVDEQLYEVYYLDKEVAQKALMKYTVISKPDLTKLNVNTASVEELAGLMYVSWGLAKEIISYRNLNGGINSLNELLKVEDFPKEKIDRITLYLTL